MPHRTSSAALLAAFLVAALSLPSGCASSSPDGSGEAPDVSDRPVLPESGVQAGWMSFKAATRQGQITALTLVSAGSQEGKLISQGRATMDGGKVVDDGTAADLILAFERAGFDRFAVRVNPHENPPGSLGAVWINRGNGLESIFLVPGARGNDETRDLPDVYDSLKKLIFTIHQATPGSVVTSGQGWSGDDMMNQQPGKKGR